MLLSSFEINFENLDGIWLIKMEYNAPLHNKPLQSGGHLPYTINFIGPSPFPSREILLCAFSIPCKGPAG